MKTLRPGRHKDGFTLIELLVVVLILGILTSIALPAYLSSVNASRMGTANANARALAGSVQGRAVSTGSYNTTLSNYATDMGGAIPLNPCSGTTTGYTITATATSATISATMGGNCGSWTPQTFVVSL